MESKGKPLTEVTTNTNLSVPKSSVQDLASLLSQELMKINQKRQNQEQIEDSETESEFDYDEDDDVNEQIYGNISNDDENSQSQIPNDQVTEVAVSDNRYDNSSHREDRKIPIYKRALPEIPRNITPPNTALKNDSSPRPPIKRGEIFKTQLIENRNFNSPTKEEKSVKRNSTLEVPRPIYSSYEDHTMKRAEAGSSKEKERDGFDNICK